MSSIWYNPIFWIFISYAIGAILADFFIKKQKVKWFDDRNCISDKTTKRIGVLILGWMVKNTFMGWFNKKIKLKSSAGREELLKVKQEMRNSEAGHLIAFYFLLIINVVLIYKGLNWWYIVLFLIINIILNLYLVYLQQYNKRRIDKVLKLTD